MKTLHTGGAEGSDLYFEMLAEKSGFEIKAYSFSNHSTRSKHKVLLPASEITEGLEHVRKANIRLNRIIPYDKSYILSLLCRNWYQVKNAKAIYAIGEIDFLSNNVKGGTGWAIAMAMDEFKVIHMFDQKTGYWHSYDHINNVWVLTQSIQDFPDSFAGIGTRQLNDAGRKAIEDLFVKYIKE